MTRRLAVSFIALAGALTAAAAPEDQARIGFIYPAGGQQGTNIEVRVGGEYIYGTTAALVSGSGVTVRVLNSRDPSPPKDEFRRRQQKRKRQSVIDEIVTLSVAIARDAEPGDREVRLLSPDGLSNPLRFQVGHLREVREVEPNDKQDAAMSVPGLPVVINGQILSGDVDGFKFTARRGQRLVVEVAARALIPYLADAVPGWFQATLALYDGQGREVAYADDYRFDPDPVLLFDVPADGEYRLVIRDSIYRGRADFVYRMALGELPFITSVFPLGARRGRTPVTVAAAGRNLPGDVIRVDVDRAAPCVTPVTAERDGVSAPAVPFALGTLPEVREDEKATRRPEGQAVTPPVVINGRIRAPGDVDAYRFEGRRGQVLHLDIQARRLGSPLDSCLVLLDRQGAKVGENDDIRDPGQGLLTHVADSEFTCELPTNGLYTVRVSDIQGRGGDEYAYRLSLAPPAPDFELRATPASFTVAQGGSVPLTLHAIRRCGFTGDIRIELDKASAPGCTLDGALLPAGTNRIRMTLSASTQAPEGVVFPVLRGTATVAGVPVTHPVTPAEDLMQAFIYQHLVPARDGVLAVTKPAVPFRVVPQLGPDGVLELPLGRETSFTVRALRRPGFEGMIRLQLEDPPKGITLRKPGIPSGWDRTFITVRTESKVEVRQGNLIFTAFMPPDMGGSRPLGAAGTNAPAGGRSTGAPAVVSGKDRPRPVRERVVVTLAAVPFRVVEDSERKKTDAGAAGKK